MKFRGQTTGDISFGAHVVTSSESGTSIGTGTGESLESKLEALSTIEDVTVSVTGSSTGKICDNDSAKFKITFTHEHGNLVRWRKKRKKIFNVCVLFLFLSCHDLTHTTAATLCSFLFFPLFCFCFFYYYYYVTANFNNFVIHCL